MTPCLTLALVVATAKEYKAALAGLGAPGAPGPGQWTSWRWRRRDMRLLVTGVGPVAAGISLGRLLGAEAVGGVVNLGLAGAFDLSRVPLTGLAVATAEIFPEYGLRGETGIDPRGLGFPQLTVGGGPVYDRLSLEPETAARGMGLALPREAVRGDFATVAGVGTEAVPSAAGRLSPLPLAESMEGFALALGCALAGVPFLELRTISNRVGARPPRDWDLAGALAALSQAVLALFS
jgi:futalosine hydrolase